VIVGRDGASLRRKLALINPTSWDESAPLRLLSFTSSWGEVLWKE